MSIITPLKKINSRGKPRKVGLELEFAGLELEKTSELIRKLYGGTIEEKNRYEYEVTGTEWGDFRVELDARIMRKMAEQDIFQKLGLNLDEKSIKKSIEDAVDKLAKTVVPLEIVMPPVEIEKIEELEKLRDKLQKHKAKGTKTSLVHMFGMHLNIEAPDLNADTILAYLRSFLIIYPWLLDKLQIDISRRISPFVDPFPHRYVQRVLNINYKPDRNRLINDYLEFNPTRNRPMDLMPIFGLWDEEKISKALKGEKNTPRPTFHYRLPNSRIDDPDWSFTEEWNYWSVVEKLASENEMLRKLSRLYVTRKDSSLVSFKKEWTETVNILLDLDEFV